MRYNERIVTMRREDKEKEVTFNSLKDFLDFLLTAITVNVHFENISL